MILEISTNTMEVTSEDPMDVEYLESLFGDSVHIEKKSNLIRRGFHVTKERIVSVKFTKSPPKKRGKKR